jgi:hypothetical protein
MNETLKGVSTLETISGYSWFLIQCSWEYENDRTAMDKWVEVYNWFKNKDDKGRYSSPRDEIADEGLIALNLIGKRVFVIAGQAKSNKPLQEISSMITLATPIKVEVFAATNVFEFGNLNQSRIGFKIADPTKGTLAI